MHHIYHTEALVLSAKATGEGDRVLHCYTRELGLVSAHAKSVRELRSRLRYALQTFAHAEIDLVEGRRGWKLTSARPIASRRRLWEDPRRRLIAAQYVALVRRLVQGEERHAELFREMSEALDFLGRLSHERHIDACEAYLIVRLLDQLGYWGTHEQFAFLSEGDPWSEAKLESLVPVRTDLVRRINEALNASHL